VRAIARDMGRALGCYGHVVELRRTLVGPFGEGDAVSVEALEDVAARPDRTPMVGAAGSPLLPVEAGLAALPALAVSRSDAARLARGQAVLLRGRDAPVMSGCIAVLCQGSLLALADVEKGELLPRRIFNFSQSHG
jgi:tRNA pseudouridine55 synthase